LREVFSNDFEKKNPPCVYKSHSAYVNYTLRVEITLCV
jgi:hypothetical protein